MRSAVFFKTDIYVPLRNNGRDRMFVHKLLAGVFKEYNEIVKGLDNSFQTYTIGKINEYGQLILSQLIKIIIL